MHLKLLLSSAPSTILIILFVGYIIHPKHHIQMLVSHIDNISNFMLDNNNTFILGGDFNSLSHNSLARTGLQSIY